MCPPSPCRRPALQRPHPPAALATAPAARADRLGRCPRGACGHRATAACADRPVGARRGDRARAPAAAARQRPAPAVPRHHPIVGSAGRLLDFRLTASPESLLLGLVRLSAYTSPGVATALQQSTDASPVNEQASRRRWCYHRLLALPRGSPRGGRLDRPRGRRSENSRGRRRGRRASPRSQGLPLRTRRCTYARGQRRRPCLQATQTRLDHAPFSVGFRLQRPSQAASHAMATRPTRSLLPRAACSGYGAPGRLHQPCAHAATRITEHRYCLNLRIFYRQAGVGFQVSESVSVPHRNDRQTGQRQL